MSIIPGPAPAAFGEVSAKSAAYHAQNGSTAAIDRESPMNALRERIVRATEEVAQLAAMLYATNERLFGPSPTPEETRPGSEPPVPGGKLHHIAADLEQLSAQITRLRAEANRIASLA